MIKVLLSLMMAAPAFGDCHLYYASKGDLEGVKLRNQEVRSLSRSINQALKTSFEFANKIDHYTFGLVSAALFGSSLEDLKPVEWDKFTVTGRLIHQNTAFDAVPLRGATLTFSFEDNRSQVTTAMNGEFTESFHKIVPYTRLRLFPAPVLEFKEKYVRTAKIPVTVRVDSKVCKAETRLTEVPIEPLLFIVSDN